MRITIVGTGRAGSSFARALGQRGHVVTLERHDEVRDPRDSALVVLCVPDDAIRSVARQLEPRRERVVAHVAGSRTLEVLAPHPRVASMHPLVALPCAERGAPRLLGATYCVAGDELVGDVVASLGGRVVRLGDDRRTAYHATAAVAANHLVALLGHVQNLALAAGLTLEDFLPLARQALADVTDLGPDAALTGPAARGDMATIDAHLEAIPESERSTYVALAHAACELAERRRSQSLA